MRNSRVRLVLRIIFALLTVILWLVIWYFSSQDGETSSSVSGRAAGVLRAFLQGFLPEAWVEFLAEYIRKCAHMFLYFCLGVTTSGFFATFRFGRGWQYAVFPLVVCLLSAIVDETHQAFVPARTGQVTDVLVDGVGFALSIALFTLARGLKTALSRKGKIR